MGFELEPQVAAAERNVGKGNENQYAALPVEFGEAPKKEPLKEAEKPKADESSKPAESQKPATQIVLMNENAARTGKPLYTGDTITKEKDGLKVMMPNGDKLSINTTTGKYDLETKEQVDIRSKYKGTPWQETSIKYPNGDMLDIDTKGISMIVRGDKGILLGRDAPGGPPHASVADMQALFKKHGKADLAEMVRKNEKEATDIRDEAFKRDTWGPKEAAAMSKTYLQKAELIQEAAKLDANNKTTYAAQTEAMLRHAVDSLGREDKSDSDAAISAKTALKKYLESTPNHDAKEVQELEAYITRAKATRDSKK